MKIERPKSKQPRPEKAKLVFKGVIFDVYQWDQDLYDGTKATFEQLKRPDTVLVLPVMPDGTIMFATQNQPGKESFLGALGGRVEEGEDPLSAAKRELLEESGYDAEEFVLWKAEQVTTKIDWVIYTFIAKGVKKIGEQSLDAGEKIELKFLTLDELLKTAQNEKFIDKELVIDFLKAQLDVEKKKELQELFKPL